MDECRIQFRIQSSINRSSRSFNLHRCEDNSKAMQSAKYSVVILFLLATPSRTDIVIANNENSAVADLVDILTSCYGGHVDGVGFAGNLPDDLIRKLAQNGIPAVVIDENLRRLKPLDRLSPKFGHRLNVFVIAPSSYEHLADIVRANAFYAAWSNNMASYVILDGSPKCENQGHFLYVAWICGLVHSKVLCLEPSGGKRVVVGFNPYTRQAPVTWQLSRVVELPNEPDFTLFHRTYQKDRAICVDLDFDKTADFGGHELTIYGRRISPSRINRKKNHFGYIFHSTNFRVMNTILNSLHATPKFTDEDIGVFNRGGMSNTPNAINFEESSDLITYPHALAGFVIITKFRGNKSQLNKILTVVDVNTRYGVGVVYLITLIFFKVFVRRSLVSALLNLVRITCDNGFQNLPNNAASRLFISGILFFAVTMQGIYQGNLATLLTTIIPVRNINTMQDLVDMGYKRIYASRNVMSIIEDPYIRNHFIPIAELEKCIKFVAEDSSAACLIISDGSIDLAINSKLHVGKDYIAPVYTSFPTQWLWPAKERVNKIISRMVEGSLLESWEVKCDPKKFTDYEIDDDVKANRNFKNIDLGDVAFAFVILGVGLACASLVFVGELALRNYNSRVSTVKIQFLK